jgi:hypothetical protein
VVSSSNQGKFPSRAKEVRSENMRCLAMVNHAHSLYTRKSDWVKGIVDIGSRMQMMGAMVMRGESSEKVVLIMSSINDST